MNQVVQKFCNFSLAQSCEDMENFISYVSSKYEANSMKAISYVILVCFSLLIFVLLRRTRTKSKSGANKLEATRSFIVRRLHSGYPALERLMNEKYEHPSALDSAYTLIRELEKDLPDLMILQEKVRELEMWEAEELAERILRPAVEEAKENQKPHEAYEFEMFLVEVLIYKGGDKDLKIALLCECLADESLKDARRPLYKAIIYKMQGSIDEAEYYWNEFIFVREPAFGPPIKIDFDQFKKHVDRLQNATQEVTVKKNKFKSSTSSLLLSI